MLKYASGDSVTGCEVNFEDPWNEGNIINFREPGEKHKDGERLNAAILSDQADDDPFLELYERWYAPAVKHMAAKNPGISDQAHLFFKNEGEEDHSYFQKEFEKYIKGCEPYGREFADAVWSDCPADAIIDEVDNRLAGTPAYIRLRVKIFCMLLNVMPDAAFFEGKSWPGYFPVEFSKNDSDLKEVSDGMSFTLELKAKKLYPATIYNSSADLCHIYIIYKEEKFKIALAPGSFLRGLFSDPEHHHLVSVKGNISLNSDETRTAVIQLSGPEGDSQALYIFFKDKNKKSVPYKLITDGPFIDAAADGQGAAVAVTARGLYSTAKERILEKNGPIRVYGAGSLWVWQYADGSLKTNLRTKKGDKCFSHAIAIVENGNNSLLLHDGEQAWCCLNGSASEISEGKFVDCMLKRFVQDGVCEKAESSLMTLQITHSGKLEVI